MKLTDIIELAKQGYKPSDIKELIELSESTESKEADQKTDDHESQKVEAEEKEEPEKETPTKEDPDNSIDYKKLYEAEKEKTEMLQKANTKTDMSNEAKQDDFETVMDAVKGFM